MLVPFLSITCQNEKMVYKSLKTMKSIFCITLIIVNSIQIIMNIGFFDMASDIKDMHNKSPVQVWLAALKTRRCFDISLFQSQ